MSGDRPVQVCLTFDIEVWCGGWDNLDITFPAAFKRYVYGSSPAGDYALPRTLEILDRHGIKGVFFVESLFSARFGIEPLREIVGLIQAAGQDVQLHLHPEWQNEARVPLIANHARKRQHLFMYDVDEQTALIGHGIRLLREAGVESVRAFRAGSFACDAATFAALARNGIALDFSVNPCISYSGADLPETLRRAGTHRIGEVTEHAQSVLIKANGQARHLQVGACATAEIIEALSGFREAGWPTINILSHNFEMLIPGSNKPDPLVVRRFDKLCAYLAERRDIHPTVDTAGLMPAPASGLRFDPPSTSRLSNLRRDIGQSLRFILEKTA